MQLNEFYRNRVMGAIHGLDRVRFRGTLRWLANERGLKAYVAMAGILLKDFGKWAEAKTERLRESCAQRAKQLGIEMRYLNSSGVDKEALARQIAKEKGIKNGSICMFSVVEPCYAPAVEGNRATQQIELRMRWRKCVWIYHYWDDAEIGFGHVRLQTWLPLTVNICLNGRHWLEKQLQQAGLQYLKEGNCFPWLEDVTATQRLADQQLRTNWTELLDRLTRGSCPDLPAVWNPLDCRYYWSADETEWATDLMFHRAADVQRLYPAVMWQALRLSDAPGVLRYFGRGELTRNGRLRGGAPKQIVSDCRQRQEGLRVKHWVNGNSVKLYSKAGSVLRAETTINATREFKVYRRPENQPDQPQSWQKLRKGVSDLHRRCQVSDQCNKRYLESLAATQVLDTLKQTVAASCNRRIESGRGYRGLNPWNREDEKILKFLAKGEWAINGLRNADLQRWLNPDCDKLSAEERRKLSARCSRRLRLLRVHGLIRKVPKANRYVLTPQGQKFSQALLAASAAPTEQLMKLAA